MLQLHPSLSLADGRLILPRKKDTLGARLGAAREAAGISQYRLAQLSAVTKQSISKLEKDESSPSWETVILLAKALGVSCEQFVTDDLRPPEPPPVKRPGPKPRGK